MKSKNKKTSFEHIADLWDAKTGNTLPSKPLSNKSGSMKITIDEVVKMIGSLKGKRLYEMACGNGHLSRYFIESGVRQVFASDVSQKLITLAQTKYSLKGICGGKQFWLMDILKARSSICAEKSRVEDRNVARCSHKKNPRQWDFLLSEANG